MGWSQSAAVNEISRWLPPPRTPATRHGPCMQVDIETVMKKFQVRRGDIQDLQVGGWVGGELPGEKRDDEAERRLVLRAVGWGTALRWGDIQALRVAGFTAAWCVEQTGSGSRGAAVRIHDRRLPDVCLPASLLSHPDLSAGQGSMQRVYCHLPFLCPPPSLAPCRTRLRAMPP